MLERLRDHAIAGGVRMDIPDRAEPRPFADALHVERMPSTSVQSVVEKAVWTSANGAE